MKGQRKLFQAPMKVIDHPLRLSRTPHELRNGPPKFGEHTTAVLGALGMTAEQIRAATTGGGLIRSIISAFRGWNNAN